RPHYPKLETPITPVEKISITPEVKEGSELSEFLAKVATAGITDSSGKISLDSERRTALFTKMCTEQMQPFLALEAAGLDSVELGEFISGTEKAGEEN